MVKEIDMPVQDAQRVPNKMDVKRPTLRHIIIKMPKVKDKEMGGRVCENGLMEGIKKYRWVVTE